MSSGAIEARILGPVQLVTGGKVIDLPSSSQRRLLATLAIHAPRPVRTEWLCGVLDISAGALRQSVARLRRVVGDGVLHTSVTGYRLDADVDAALAEAELGRAGRDPDAIGQALARWSGPSLAEFADEAWAVGAATRLDEMRASGVELLGEALIGRGRAADAIGVLEAHIQEHPFRDRPRGLLIRALAAGGRRTEALRAYHDYRSFLADETGIEPSDDLRRIEQRVATGWDGIDDEAVGAESATGRTGWQKPPGLADSLTVTTTLIGRQPELDALARATDAALDARRLGVVLLSGEAGIGKTTLIGEFSRRHGMSRGRSVWYGRSDELAAEPFQPFRGVLTQLLEALPEQAIVDHVAARGADLVPLLPQLGRSFPATTRAAPSDEIAARHLLFEAAADLLRRAADIGPLLIVLDDLHWAEPTALQLFRHLVRGLADSPIVFVASFRDTGEAEGDHLRSALADLARSDAVRVELAGLDTGALGEMVRAQVGSSAAVDVGSVADQLGVESAGNPLFAEHLVRHWSASGGLVVGGDAVTLAPRAAGEVSATLRDLVWHRVGVLGAEGRRVLSAAAVLGTEFDESVLATVAGTDRHELDNLLDRAVAAGLLEADPARPGVMRFGHALVARAMDEELGYRERARLHERAFEALAGAASAANERPAQLARHAERAGLPDAALTWSVRAGERALTDLTPDEAAQWFHRAIAHAVALGRPDSDRADLLVRLGEAEYRAGHATAIDTLHAAAELALQAGDDDTLLRAALAIAPGSIRLGSTGPKQLAIAEAALARTDSNDQETRTLMLAMLARSLVSTDQTERRMTAAHEALTLARESDDPDLLVRIAPDLLFALWAPGTAALRVQIARDAVETVEESGEPHQASILYHAAHNAAVCAGEAELAAHCAERLHALSEEIKEPRIRWISALIDGFDASMECRFDEAERLIEDCYRLGSQIGETEAFAAYAGQFFMLGSFRGRQGEMAAQIPAQLDASESVVRTFAVGFAIAALESGHTEAARAVLDEAIQRGAESIPADLMRSPLLIGFAILALELGDTLAAEWLVPELEPMRGEVSYNGAISQGPVDAYLGKLSTLLGRYDDAERQLRDGLVLAERFGWKYHIATTLCALVDNRLAAGRELDAEGSAWLDEAERLCEAYGIRGWVRRVAAMRAQLAG